MRVVSSHGRLDTLMSRREPDVTIATVLRIAPHLVIAADVVAIRSTELWHHSSAIHHTRKM